MRYHQINLIENKRLGAFYTPQGLAAALAHWAIRTGDERILEPSAGGGALLVAANARANDLGNGRLSGLACDIDSAAVAALKSKVGGTFKLLLADFLTLDPAAVRKVDVVLANPPFTRNHSIEHEQRQELRLRFGTYGAAGIWVAFLLHAKEFLKPGGRIVSIVPRSALFTEYGRRFAADLRSDFASFNIVPIAEPPDWSVAADERGAVLIAEGYKNKLSPKLSPWKDCTVSFEGPPEEAEPKVMAELRTCAFPLGSAARLSIGAVTGCNKVFLLSEAERLEFKIPLDAVVPIVSRSRQILGLKVGKAALIKAAVDGEKTWLLSPHKLGNGVRRRLSLISPEQRETVVWLNKRDPWWRVDTGQPCDGIFTYMNDRGPRLILVSRDVTCTNTLHKVTFSSNIDRIQRQAIALSLITSFGALACELLGRQYGGGLLKFELTEARAIPCLPSSQDCSQDFKVAHSALARGDHFGARALADEIILRPLLGRSWRKAAQEMQRDLDVRQRRRRGIR